MALQARKSCGGSSHCRARALLCSPSAPLCRAGAPLSTACRSMSPRKSTQPVDVIVHGIARRGDARSPRVTGCASRRRLPEGAVLQANAAQIEALSRRGRSPLARRRRGVVHVGHERRDRRRPGAGGARRASRSSPARASASRSSTRASGPATARSPAASSIRRISSATATSAAKLRQRRPLRARHAHRRDHRGQLAVSAGLDVSDAVPRRRAWRPSHQPARDRRRRHGQGQRRDGRHRLGHPEPQALQHPRHQPVARRARPRSRTATTRCARPSSARCTRASSWWRRRAIAAKTRRGAACTG